MKRFGMGVAAICLSVLVSGWLSVNAQEEEATVSEGIPVTLTGMNYDVLEYLDQESMATIPEAYRKWTALRVAEATADLGEAIEELAGKTLHYLLTPKGLALIQDNTVYNETVEVRGTWFQQEQVLRVERYELSLDTEAWTFEVLGSKSNEVDL